MKDVSPPHACLLPCFRDLTHICKAQAGAGRGEACTYHNRDCPVLVLEACKPEPSQPFDVLQASAVRVRLAGSMQVQLHVCIV